MAKNVKVQIFHYLGDKMLFDCEKLPDVPPAAEGLVDYWSYAEAIFEDAARAIVRQGFTGFRSGWKPSGWDIDFHYSVLPVEHFFYLAALVKSRAEKRSQFRAVFS